jgi:hypothetical protein
MAAITIQTASRSMPHQKEEKNRRDGKKSEEQKEPTLTKSITNAPSKPSQDTHHLPTHHKAGETSRASDARSSTRPEHNAKTGPPRR